MKKTVLFYLPLLTVFFFYLSTSSLLAAQTQPAPNPISISPLVTATVPAYFWLELSGWTSPWAQVELTMKQVVTRITKANKQGKFVFRIALPRELGPFCLIATDISQISSHPLCIAPPPPEVNILIKEVVMPPTLKIDKGKILEGETVAAQGYTTPNSPVVPFAFEPKRWSRFSFSLSHLPNFFFKNALAAEVPKPPLMSDQNGFYQFNLPTSTLGKNRIFTSSIFLANPSPKSTTLVFDVLSWWRMLIEKFLAFVANLLWLVLSFLKNPKGIIAVEIVILLAIIGYLVFTRKKVETKSKLSITQKSPKLSV